MNVIYIMTSFIIAQKYLLRKDHNMKEEFEMHSGEETEQKENCKCAGKDKSKTSCKGGCSCSDNSIKKARQEIVDLLKMDLF